MTTYILGDNAPRKSNFDPDLAKKLTKYYEENPEALKGGSEVSPASIENWTKQPPGEYILMPQTKPRFYGVGLHALQQECIKENNQNHPKFTLPNKKVVYRPNTIKENCLASLHQFNTFTNADGSQRTLEQRMEFLNQLNKSCCGIAYSVEVRNSSKFKLILQSPELIGLSKSFNQDFVSVDYDTLTCTRELDRNRAKYNEQLTPDEIDSHEGWLTVFEDDATALRDYRKMVGDALALIRPQDKQPKFMSFRICDVPENDFLLRRLNKVKEDSLRAVFTLNVDNKCQFDGISEIDVNGSFFRRKP